MIIVDKKYIKNNLFSIVPLLVILFLFLNFNIINIAFFFMLSIILILIINLVYKNKKYKKLYSLAEANKRRYRITYDRKESTGGGRIMDFIRWRNMGME